MSVGAGATAEDPGAGVFPAVAPSEGGGGG
jgi:hypothetical protein